MSQQTKQNLNHLAVGFAVALLSFLLGNLWAYQDIANLRTDVGIIRQTVIQVRELMDERNDVIDARLKRLEYPADAGGSER